MRHQNYPQGVYVGLDVGSTTVKAVVMDPLTDEILWSDYQRHETKQPEKVLEFLQMIKKEFPLEDQQFRIFITGSGGGSLTPYLGAKFVQEVNAVSLAVEKNHPEAGSVIELGGQDAKIIIWVEDPKTGARRKLPSMNDKCAGGTGAVIDKINAKLRLSSQDLQALKYFDVKLHPVAGKCGVFAETDINGLQKQGVPPQELMASLFEAIVQQNLSVLTRGNTLRPKVLLLGGPNTFIPAMQDAWRHNIPKIWEERKFPLPEGVEPKDLIVVPNNAQYYAAMGAVLYGKSEDAHIGVYKGDRELVDFIEYGRQKMREASGDKGLVENDEELQAFLQKFKKKPFEPAKFQCGEVVEGYLGIDGGSTSTKGVIMSRDGRLLAKAYQLSKGNPLEDTKEILRKLREAVELQGAILKVSGVGTTGYAKDILKDTVGADIALVETVAHTQSALHYYKDVHVIVDVGGQDIKVIVLNHGKVKDFKLNTQCSAGNGYFLQSTAGKFGHPVEEFADIAFGAERLPLFSYGCAVFMESDIVNFQQLGWSPKEIMAGLAKVLPKNIWLYVVSEPNLAKFGRRFVLQGGTQHNMAAVKAQYDFIKEKVPDAEVFVHEYCGESGAIGAALDSIRAVGNNESTFIGFEAAENLSFTTTRDESTRCYFCKNKCLRTFIDTQTPKGENRRFIIATCEKGTVEDVDEMKKIKASLDAVKGANPNFVEIAAKYAFKSYAPQSVADYVTAYVSETNQPQGLLGRLFGKKKEQVELPWWADREKVKEKRDKIRIGLPRVLNMYSTGPFWSAYLEAIGIPAKNLVWSDYTEEKMYKEGSRRGSIDACFPSKIGIAHVHNLIYGKGKNVNAIFFPTIVSLRTDLQNTQDSAACPTVQATPNVAKAAFTKEGDIFAECKIEYYDPPFYMGETDLFEKELFDFFSEWLGVTREENRLAIEAGNKAIDKFLNGYQRAEARKVLDQLTREGRVGVVCLARPYHNDPGLNHEILEEIQKRGYPIFSLWSLPLDEDILEELFGEEIARGELKSAMDITDVWKNCYSENSSMKVWGAKYVARHPNLVAVDLSSFKCGHDAPIYSVVESIVESSGTPFFTFHDIDENKPSGSIKIRVETIDYFLKRYEEAMRREDDLQMQFERELEEFKARLRFQHGQSLVNSLEAVAGD
ncbi:MAG: BadF/BadG/BcrA/BcrD ATPase family protein [Acidobacteriota bacterium]